MTKFSKRDAIRIIEPLVYWEDPDQRLKFLRKAHHTYEQKDFSHWKKVTKQNVWNFFKEQTRFDVPPYTQDAFDWIWDYLDRKEPVYQYVVCWVPEHWEIDNELWLYTGKVAEIKDVTYRRVREYCSNGYLESKFIKVNDGYPKRRYIKPDFNLEYWVNNTEDLLPVRLDIASKFIDKCDTLDEVCKEVEEFERLHELEMKGSTDEPTIKDFFTRYTSINNIEDLKKLWIY